MAEKDQRISGLRSGGDDYITKPYDVDELRERVAANYLSKQRGHTFRITANYINDKRYCRAKNLLTTEDMFCADFLYNRIPNELDPFDYNAFEKSDSRMTAVVTNVDTGKPEYKPLTDLRREMQWLRASCYLPLPSKFTFGRLKNLLCCGKMFTYVN